MQNNYELKNVSAFIVEGVSPKTNKPYMIFKLETLDGKTLHSEFVSDFYKQEYFRNLLRKEDNL